MNTNEFSAVFQIVPNSLIPVWQKVTGGNFGGKLQYWLSHNSSNRQFIQEIGAKPASEEMLAAYMTAMPIETKEHTGMMMKRLPIWGGIRVPHLHVDGNIFLLDEKQWKEFSIKMIKEFQSKLSRVNSVSFEHAMELSEAVDTLA